jgi:hypothetical protein
MSAAKEILGVFKCIHTYLNKLTAYEILKVDTWGDKDEFEDIWNEFQKSPFHGLCALDDSNLDRVFEWAIDRMQRV